MSVTAVTPVSPRMWRGYDDPGLPVGTYISLGLVIGDASGGTITVEHQFKTIGNPASARLYNIEAFNAFSTLNSDVRGSLRAVGFEELPTANVTVQRWTYELQTDGSAFGVIDFSKLPRLPIFIGQSTPDAATLAAVRASVPNPGAGIVFQSVIQGYIWEPRSAQASGGLRRPLDRLYG